MQVRGELILLDLRNRFFHKVASRYSDAYSSILTTSAQRQHQVKHRPTLDVVVLRSAVIIHLLTAENQSVFGTRGEGVSRGAQRMRKERLFVASELFFRVKTIEGPSAL